MEHTLRVRAGLAGCLILLLMSTPVLAQKKALTLDAIHASDTFDSETFRRGKWADEGPIVRYIEAGANGATHLVAYNLEDDTQERLIDGTKLYANDVQRLIKIEDYAYSQDKSKVLLYTDSERVWRQNTKGYYYLYDLSAETLTGISDRSKGFQMFAKLNPAGDKVAFVRDRNLFMVDLGTMTETQLTNDGAEGTIINGTFDWVYEEEFGLRDGWSWSPDGQHIAFFKLDESATKDFVMADLRSQYPDLVNFRYPKAGEDNSEVQVGVLDVATGDIEFIDTNTWNAGGDTHEYISRMGWTPQIDGEHKVWMFRMDRDQNDLEMMYAQPSNQAVSTVVTEREDTWISVRGSKLTFLGNGSHFVWESEVDGYNHLYLYSNDGQPVAPITSGEWDVAQFHGIDEERGVAYFTAAIENPLERHLYSIDLNMRPEDGTITPSPPTKITQEAGTHAINMSSDLSYYIDTFSNSTTPPTVRLHAINGNALKTLAGNERLKETLTEYAIPEPEFVTVPAADGTPLNAMLYKPSNFDPNRAYPLMMYVYGGPGSQTVRDSWGGARALWFAFLAEEMDVLVASVDNRGTGARGKAFKSITYKRLGQIEADDQVAAAQHLGSQSYVDANRIGIWGWSYGGYMTLMSMLYGDGPATFKLGVSGAPVTDWRLYDTIYTERYMSTPQKNTPGYDDGSALNYVDRLTDDQRLLIIHGDLDDNVHYQQSIQLLEKLQEANKYVQFMVYPGLNHGAVRNPRTQRHVYTLMTNFIRENL